MSTASQAKKELKKFSTSEKAKSSSWFFKTGKGEYGEGDLFLGVTVPENRKIAKKFKDLDLTEIKKLLESPYHEERLLGGFILVGQFQKKKSDKEKIFKFYLKNRAGINNWDLVDSTSYHIFGEHQLQSGNSKYFYKYAKSKKHWDRRIAMVGTYAFIRANKVDIVFELAEMFLSDKEDLMHKATGWMLREAGKKDKKKLLKFLNKFGKQMPRTMLRYSIERFPEKERKEFLLKTK